MGNTYKCIFSSSDTQTTNWQNFRLGGSELWKRIILKFCLTQRETVICQTLKMIFLVNLCWKWSLSRMAHLSLLVRPFYLTNWYSSTCSEYATHFSSEQHRTKWNANIVRQRKTNSSDNRNNVNGNLDLSCHGIMNWVASFHSELA